MRRLVVIRSYPQGPRVWLCGQRCHHGASGIIGGLACLALRRRRASLALFAWAATDWHDARVWFKREGVPSVSGLTVALDELSQRG